LGDGQLVGEALDAGFAAALELDEQGGPSMPYSRSFVRRRAAPTKSFRLPNRRPSALDEPARADSRWSTVREALRPENTCVGDERCVQHRGNGRHVVVVQAHDKYRVGPALSEARHRSPAASHRGPSAIHGSQLRDEVDVLAPTDRMREQVSPIVVGPKAPRSGNLRIRDAPRGR